MPHISTKNNRVLHTAIPPRVFRVWRDCCFVIALNLGLSATLHSQPAEFVRRSNDTLQLGSQPFYFVGANAYYLLEQAARGDTTTVKELYAMAQSVGMNVVRTWGFYDSSDSLLPAVIQYRPGVFNEHALQALDYVVYQARLYNIRLLIPLVNSWDDYGGMNQYVRWRSLSTGAIEKSAPRFSSSQQERVIDGGNGRLYRYAPTSHFAHDDFYSDPTIKTWFKNYASTILNRMNTYTHIRYKDDPFIFGWELANEPRSSDPSARIVNNWIVELSLFVKSIAQNHLLGTGEEGFDISAAPYSMNAYNNQYWLFNGTEGVAFSQNSATSTIDFASCHLYPESWGVSYSAGNVWIRDHIRIARSLNKPLLVGEFGARTQQAAAYSSWLSTALLDGAAGAMVWQMLAGPRSDREGFGFRCPENELLCIRLSDATQEFRMKSQTGETPKPTGFMLRQNYPNPFNGVTTIVYALPYDAYVSLSLFNSLGQEVVTLVDGIQSAGLRREVLGAEMLASGAYFYKLSIADQSSPLTKRFSQTKKLLLLR